MSPLTQHTLRPGAIALTLLALAGALAAQGEMGNPNVVTLQQGAATMGDKIGAMVNPELSFTDERGYPLKLRQFFPGTRPVILDLGYFGCPGLCGAVMGGMVDALNQVDLEPGKDYEILSISIDPRETSELAKAKKDAFLVKLTKIGGAEGWHFAVGKEAAVKELADSVGFHYFWAEHDNRFDHPAALVFLSPKGQVTRVLQGTTFDPGDVKLALTEASEGRLGTFWDRIVLSCLTFDPRTHSYSLTVMTIMKVGGAVTLVVLALMIIIMLRREKKRHLTAAADTASAH
jgi:protein SCO1